MSTLSKGNLAVGQLKRGSPSSLLASVVLLVLLALVAVSCGGTAGEQRADGSAEGEPAEDEPQTGTQKTQSGTAEEQAEADLENPSLGSESASVVMTEYADYQ